MPLQKSKDKITEQTFEQTIKEAQKAGVCINCKESVLNKCYSEAGIREYKISGLCEICFIDREIEEKVRIMKRKGGDN